MIDMCNQQELVQGTETRHPTIEASPLSLCCVYTAVTHHNSRWRRHQALQPMKSTSYFRGLCPRYEQFILSYFILIISAFCRTFWNLRAFRNSLRNAAFKIFEKLIKANLKSVKLKLACFFL